LRRGCERVRGGERGSGEMRFLVKVFIRGKDGVFGFKMTKIFNTQQQLSFVDSA
jgi:hypothetical protein